VPKTLQELFDEAKTLGIDFSDDKAREAAIDALKTSWHGFYQAIANIGFGAANAEHEKVITGMTKQITDLQNKLTTAETAIREKQDKAPDVKTINEQWEAKLLAERTAAQTALEAEQAKTREVLYSRDDAAFEAELVSRKVPKSVAKVLAASKEARDRRSYDGNALSVLQAGQKIPFSPGSGQTHLGLLADEYVSRPDIAEILTSNGDSGSGVSGQGGPGGGDAAFYEGLRKSAQSNEGQGVPKVPLRERVKGR
jgi:hypothetical protein